MAGSASYRNLPEMLVQIERGERATGLDDRNTEETFETEFTARTNPHRGYITIIEGCDKFCAYCVVPYTRGRERSRTSESVLEEARRIVDSGLTEIQLLGQNVNSYRDPLGRRSFAELLAEVGQVPGIRRVRFTTSHPRHFTPRNRRGHRLGANSLRPRASSGAERFVAGARGHGSRIHARAVPGTRCMDSRGKESIDLHDYRYHRWLPGRKPCRV